MNVERSGFVIVLPHKRVEQIIFEELEKTYDKKEAQEKLKKMGIDYYEQKFYRTIIIKLRGFIKSEVKDWRLYEKYIEDLKGSKQ